jgi:hypothetical protein
MWMWSYNLLRLWDHKLAIVIEQTIQGFENVSGS